MMEFAKKDLDLMNEVRQKAFDYSSTDPIGHVFIKSIDLLKDLVQSDADPEKLKKAGAALKSERDLVMECDKEKDDPTRAGIYSLFETMELAFNWYGEREKKRRAAAAAVMKVSIIFSIGLNDYWRKEMEVVPMEEDEEDDLCNVSAVEGDDESKACVKKAVKMEMKESDDNGKEKEAEKKEQPKL